MSTIKITISLVFIYLFCSHCNAGQLSAALVTGYEAVSSPLVRIDLDSPLILVEGRTELASPYYQFNLNGVKDWDFGNESEFSFSANSNIKISPNAEGLNFSMLSIDAIWRKKLNELNFEIGPSVQRIWVANADFRDSLALQFDVTHVRQNGSYTDLYFEFAKKYFVEEIDFFDSKSATVSLIQHMKDIGFGFSALDFELSATREQNIKDANELSNKTFYGRVSLDREMLGLTWSAGVSVTHSIFDAPFSDGFDRRRDLYVSYEFGVERKFSDHVSMSLALTKAENHSNLALFESDYQLISLSLNYMH